MIDLLPAMIDLSVWPAISLVFHFGFLAPFNLAFLHQLRKCRFLLAHKGLFITRVFGSYRPQSNIEA